MIGTKVSGYYIAGEISRGYPLLEIAIGSNEWSQFRALSEAVYLDLLLTIATTVDLAKYRKSSRGPKKPRPERTEYLDKPHVSTARLLLNRN